MSSSCDVVETIEFPNGIACDLDEGWPKLTSRQFGGEPGRAFPELIQNAIDSYPSDTSWEDRLLKIETGENTISITDYGEGMGRDRLRLLVTLGGTDKQDDPNKIGKFGLGFFAMFSPKLYTRLVRVLTRCEGQSVELTFKVQDPRRRPELSYRILGTPLSFSTQIQAEFAERSSPVTCLEHARRYLRFYPCRALINGRPCATEWQTARGAGARFFKEGACDGFIRQGNLHGGVHLLCKYEHILSSPLQNFITGGRGSYDLRDFRTRQVPYIPGIEATLNCNSLNVTISRDGYYLDWAWEHAVRTLAQALIGELSSLLDGDVEPQLVVANQYALQNLIKPHIGNAEDTGPGPVGDPVDAGIRKLADAEVYRLNGRRDRYSIRAIAAMRSAELPLFFSPRQANLRWLGGEFKHDFIVLPPSCSIFNGAPDLYDDLFRTWFGDDVVNLDTIRDNPVRIAQLVERNIVDRRALRPTCKIAGVCSLREDEARLLHEIDVLLSRPGVSKAIAKELHMPIGRIRSALFDVDAHGITIATGLFGPDDTPLDDGDGQPPPRNLAESDEPAALSDIRLGLLRSHPFIRHLIGTDDPYRSYYALTFVSCELARCQRQLVPYSPFFHFVKEQLAAAMRRALLDETVPCAQETDS